MIEIAQLHTNRSERTIIDVCVKAGICRFGASPHIYSQRSRHLHSSLQFSFFLPLAIFSQIRYSKCIAHYMIHEINEARIYDEQYRTTPDG